MISIRDLMYCSEASVQQWCACKRSTAATSAELHTAQKKQQHLHHMAQHSIMPGRLMQSHTLKLASYYRPDTRYAPSSMHPMIPMSPHLTLFSRVSGNMLVHRHKTAEANHDASSHDAAAWQTCMRWDCNLPRAAGKVTTSTFAPKHPSRSQVTWLPCLPTLRVTHVM
jgi:hypothetical protein